MSAIQTYTGIMIDPLNPKKEEIKVEDVAHALSLLCRANGHFPHFYSVGQHSINCMKEAEARGLSKRVQLACLTHDASEAYLSDVTRPVKAHLPRYKEIEAPLQELIWTMWLDAALNEQERKTVRAIDDDILTYELWKMMGRAPAEENFSLHSVPQTAFTGFATCEEEFLQLFRELREK